MSREQRDIPPLRTHVVHLLWLPLPAAVLTAVVLNALFGDVPYQSAALLTLFNTLFLGSVSLLVALIAWMSARSTGQWSIVWLGCGAQTMGLAALLAGPLISDVNDAITVFNVGFAGAAVCLAVAAALALRTAPVETEERIGAGRATIVHAFAASLVLILALAAARDLTPDFWVPGEGTSMLRFVVLLVAIAGFGIAALVFLLGYHRSRVAFTRWFSAAFAMLALGLVLVLVSTPASVVGWTGRAAQWTGAFYMLVGIVSAATAFGTFSLPLHRALSEAELRLRLIMDGAGIGLFELDLERDILRWDDTVREHFGLGRSARVDVERFLELVHPSDRKLVQEVIARSCDPAGDGGFDAEYRIVRASDGETRWMLARGSTSFVAEEPVRILGVLFDITKRKRIEEALRESEERFRIMADGLPFPVWVHDAKGDLKLVNRTYCEFFGVSEEQVSGQNWSPLLHPEDAERYVSEFEAAMAEHRPFHCVARARDARGEWRWVESSASPRLAASGSFLGMVGSSPDVTERRQAEHALLEAEREKATQRERSRLARDLHDSVTQALFAATLKAEALTASDNGDRDKVDAIADEVRQLTRGALAQMRILLLELRGDPVANVPIAQLLRNLVEATESRARVVVRLTVDDLIPMPPEVHEATYRITQEALNNVARHARATTAWVTLATAPSRVRLTVRDNGQGFDGAPQGREPHRPHLDARTRGGGRRPPRGGDGTGPGNPGVIRLGRAGGHDRSSVIVPRSGR